jgi:Flp pilus assembly pilin Flp
MTTMLKLNHRKTQKKMPILNLIKANVKTQRGAAMVEYAFLVILIAIIAFIAVQIAGQQVSVAFSTVADGFTNPN